MFSGIVQETGKVIEFVKEKDIYNLSMILHLSLFLA
ncbi:MAG: hypothetical protein Ct9H90mP6_01530 [Gammaproteobacteria bacterium]|nr:MAG: hypothetical protein Ct9H90mP6_01530 [Gammaproteobacteria bacterium]